MGRGKAFAAILVLAVLTVPIAAPSASATIYPNDRTYARGWDGKASGDWVGAKANMEVRSGTIGSADATNWGFVAETLWIAPSTTSDYWVEVEVTRGWEGDNVLTFYWACMNNTSPYYHEQMVWNINASAYVGTQPEFKIVRVGTSRDWNILIDGTYANDVNDDHTANSTFASLDAFPVGMESNCSTGKYATLSNPANCTSLKKKVPSGSWSNAPAYTELYDNGYELHEVNSSGVMADGAWTTVARSLWNYRND